MLSDARRLRWTVAEKGYFSYDKFQLSSASAPGRSLIAKLMAIRTDSS